MNDTVYNDDELKTANTKGLSFYKGTLVLNVDLGSINSFTHGKIMILNVSSTISDEQKINLVRHEYGHSVQFEKTSAFDYFAGYAIPSVAVCSFDKVTGLIDEELYYSLPWERSADLYGGVERKSADSLFDYRFDDSGAFSRMYSAYRGILPW